MMKYFIYNKVYLLLGLCVVVVLASCSTTDRLPEGEQLYVGLDRISFDHPMKMEKKHSQTGVITAINDAYQSVESILNGTSTVVNASSQDNPQLSSQQRDSILTSERILKEARDLTEEEVRAVLSIKPNNSLMGSTKVRFPLPFGLWIYNRYMDSDRRFGRWMYNNFAVKPKLISAVNPALRARIATNVLHNYGFFQGTVVPHTVTLKDSLKARLAYDVYPGQQYLFGGIEYKGYSAAEQALIEGSRRRTLLRTGQPFQAAKLEAERNRLNTLFRDNGFFYCQPAYFTFRADTLQQKGRVQLQVIPSAEMTEQAGHPYHLRNTRIHLIDRLRGEERYDTLGRGAVRMLYSVDDGHRKPSVRYGILRRNISYRRGDLYSQTMLADVQGKFSSLGIFSQVGLECAPIDSTYACDSLDVDIYAVLDKRYDSEFKANVATKSNGLLGPGLGWTMTRRNAFRGAEALSLNAYGSYEWQTGAFEQQRSSIMNSYEYGTSLNLDYPYIKFGRLARKLNRHAQTSTAFKLEANCLNRARYFGRVTFGASVSMSYQRKPNLRHELTPFRLDYTLQFHSTQEFDELMQENAALAVSMRNQFVPSMQYVMKWSKAPRPKIPRSFTLTVKEAGNVVSGIYGCFGKSFSTQDKDLFGVPFAQYIKAVAEYRHKYRMGVSNTYLATRMLLGSVYSYGNAHIAPYNDMLTIGGANSIRAFGIRSIGPGSYHPSEGRYSYVDQIGDLKLELNAEYRFPIVGDLEGAAFLDCGNVWMINNNEDHPGGAFKLRNLGRELALGTGVGLRYDLDFLVVRFDLGIGLHAPYDTGRSGYYNMTSFGRSLGYHLAIGYPF